MSNYTKTTDFDVKDSLPSGDTGKIIRGSEFEVEFENIEVAIASKADSLNTVLTGTTTATNLSVTGNTTLGNVASDTVTVNADFSSDLLPSADATYDLGAPGSEWQDLYVTGTANIDSLVADTVAISGGTVTATLTGNVTGDVTGDLTGTVLTAAQPNITSVGTLTSLDVSGDISFGDNDKAIFGANSDLEIYSDGTDSYITEGTAGNFFIQGAIIKLQTGNGAKDYLVASPSAEVTLYYDNSAKLATTNTGVDVTGTVTADGLDVSNGNIKIEAEKATTPTNDGADYIFRASNAHPDYNGGDLIIQARSSASRDIYMLTGTTTPVNRLKVDGNGDISFYEDTGTTTKFFWDASAESLGIGTSSITPSTSLHIQGSAGASGADVNIAANEFLVDNNGDTGMTLGSATTGTGYYAFADSDVALRAGLFYDHSTDYMGFRVASDERMRIDSSGKVGIGTSNPIANLEISSPADTRVRIADSGNVNQRLDFDHNNGASFITAGNNGANGVLVFRRWDGTSNTESMRIDASGNVGIGTSTPARALHVSDVMRLEPRATAPSSPSAGDIFFNSTTNKLQCYDGTAWQDCF